MTDTVLVTGATGFIGRPLVAHLARSGWNVRAAARVPERIEPWDGVTGVQAPDLEQMSSWQPQLDGVTHIVHLAGIAHSTRSIADETYTAVNASAVAGLARAARLAGVRRIVLLSSVRAQAGPAEVERLSEDSPPRPTDAYGRSKLAGENQLKLALEGGGTDYVILRPVVVYGQGAKANMKTLARLARSPLPLPIGKITSRRSILAIDNLIGAIEHTLVSTEVAGGTFLVADTDPLTLGEMISAMRAGTGRHGRVLPISPSLLYQAARIARRGADWQRISGTLVVDTSKLQATGWVPRVNAQAGLFSWMRATHPQRD